MPLSKAMVRPTTRGMTQPMIGGSGAPSGGDTSDTTLLLLYTNDAYFIGNRYQPATLALDYALNEYWVDESSSVPAA